MALQIYTTFAVLGYLLFYKPLESPLASRLEVFNEVTILNMTYMLMCFSGFVHDEVTRSNVGFFYVGVIIINIAVHLTLLLLSNAWKLKLIFRRYRCCCMPKVNIAKKFPLALGTK